MPYNFRISGILVPPFFMSFLDQFSDGISIAVGFIVIRVREHLHFDKNTFFFVWYFFNSFAHLNVFWGTAAEQSSREQSSSRERAA